MSEAAAEAQRIDRWLWHARLFRTRSLAQEFAASGKLRINGTRVTKASHSLSPGDVLTFPLAGNVRVLRVTGSVERRGPYSVAQTLYEDLSPPVAGPGSTEGAVAERPAGTGRPTKRERRHIAGFTDPPAPDD